MTYEGPEVEDDVTNFQMLNIPPDHPARDLWDTLYVDIEGHLLRTHTSPGQIRVMRSTAPPIRALLPGRCYRYEAIDASHASEFFQVEGLMVDEGTTMGDLKGLLDQFAKAMYGADKRTRFRPGYYPFTEPSVAFDVECLVCGGSGCPACSRTGWMTILGAGMVHPVVLRVRRPRPGALPGLRVRDGRRADREPAPLGRRSAAVHGERPPLPRPVRRGGVGADRASAAVLAPRLRRGRPHPEALAERLTLLGMEVKGIERWGAEWRNVVVGELLTVEKHPNADRLSLTTVRVGDGGEPLDDRVRRDEHRRRASASRSPCREPSCPAIGGSSGPRRWASSATGCSARATS